MQEALACAACGDTLSKDWGTQGVSTHPGFTADLAYSYINQSQQRYGSGIASPAFLATFQAANPPNGQEVEDYTVTRTITASLNYSSDTWGVNTQLPYVQRAHGTFGTTDLAGTSYSSSSDSGIGDVRVTGRYTGFSADNTAGIIAGIKLPTGSTGTNFNAGAGANTAVDRSLQIGTGSTDLVLGGFLAGAVDEYGWFAQGTVQHAVATKVIAGLDYRPGDAYALNAGIRNAKFGAKFTPMLQLNYIHRQPDSPDTGANAGATPPDALTGGPATGGTLVYFAPGASVRIGGGTSVYGFLQLPVYQNVNSLQLSPRYTLTFGVKHSYE
ncbi:MAG: hypothetical protein HY016_02665 [Nitrosomonadales bacterium]|nr:hypothetical protein [Nitrosomonadales bacterium]